MRSFDVLYTVNGSDPSVYGILYDPIRPPVLTVSRTVKAITRTLDLEDSVVSVSQFVVHQVAAPTFSPPTVEGTICDSGAARTILFEDNWVNCVDGQPLRDSGGQLVPEPKPAEYAFDETRASYVTTRWGRAPHRFDVGGEPITIHVHSDTEDEPPECLPGCAGTANVNNDGCGAAPTPGNNVQIYYTLQGKIPTDPNFRADSADPGTIISAPDTCRILSDGIRLCGPDPATESGTSISDTFLLPGPCDPWFANGDTEASHACPCITGEECSTVREYDPALGITLRGGTFESVDGRVTVTAYAKKVGFTDSDVVQAGYVMKAKMPSMFPCGFGGGGGNPSCLGTGETWVGGTYVDLITETTNYGAMVTDIKYQRECLANTPYAEGMVRYNDAMPPYIPLSCNLIAFTTRSGLENSDTTRAAYQVQMLKPRFTVADGTYCDDGQDMTTPLESEDDAIGGTPTIGVVISIENHICSDQDGPYPSGFNAAAPLASPLPTRNQDNENRWHRLGPIANGLAHLSGSGELDSCNGTQMAYPWSTDSTAATGGTCSDAAPGTCSNGCGAPVCNVQRDAWIFYNIMYTDFADSLVDADAQYTAEPSYVGSIPRTDADVSLLAGVLGDPAAVNNLVSGSFENGSYAYSYADHDGDYYGYSKYTPCSPPDGSDVITTCKFSVRQSCVIKAISEHYSMVTSDVATGNFKVRMAAPCPCVQCPCPAADPVCPFTGTPVSENPAAPNGDVVLTSVSGTASIGTTCDCNLCSRLAATSANAGVKATCNAFCGSFEATAEQPCKAGQYEISAVSLPLWSESPRKVVPGANMPDHGRVEVWYSTDDLAMKLSDMIPGGEMDPNNPSDAFFSMGASSGGVCTDGSDGIVKPSRSTKVRVDSTTFNSNDRMQPATSGDAYDTPGRLFVDQMVGAQAKRCFFGSTDPAYCADIQCVGGDDDNCATPAGDKNMLDEPDKRYPDASFRKDYLGLCPRTWTPLRLAWPTHNEMARTFRPNMNHADFNTTCAPPASWAADYYGSREPGTTATVCAFTAAVDEATVCNFTAAVTDPTDASVTAASCAKTSASAPGACAVNDAGTGCDGDADVSAASCAKTSASAPGACAVNGDNTACTYNCNAGQSFPSQISTPMGPQSMAFDFMGMTLYDKMQFESNCYVTWPSTPVLEVGPADNRVTFWLLNPGVTADEQQQMLYIDHVTPVYSFAWQNHRIPSTLSRRLCEVKVADPVVDTTDTMAGTGTRTFQLSSSTRDDYRDRRNVVIYYERTPGANKIMDVDTTPYPYNSAATEWHGAFSPTAFPCTDDSSGACAAMADYSYVSGDATYLFQRSDVTMWRNEPLSSATAVGAGELTADDTLELAQWTDGVDSVTRSDSYGSSAGFRYCYSVHDVASSTSDVLDNTYTGEILQGPKAPCRTGDGDGNIGTLVRQGETAPNGYLFMNQFETRAHMEDNAAGDTSAAPVPKYLTRQTDQAYSDEGWVSAADGPKYPWLMDVQGWTGDILANTNAGFCDRVGDAVGDANSGSCVGFSCSSAEQTTVAWSEVRRNTAGVINPPAGLPSCTSDFSGWRAKPGAKRPMASGDYGAVEMFPGSTAEASATNPFADPSSLTPPTLYQGRTVVAVATKAGCIDSNPVKFTLKLKADAPTMSCRSYTGGYGDYGSTTYSLPFNCTGFARPAEVDTIPAGASVPVQRRGCTSDGGNPATQCDGVYEAEVRVQFDTATTGARVYYDEVYREGDEQVYGSFAGYSAERGYWNWPFRTAAADATVPVFNPSERTPLKAFVGLPDVRVESSQTTLGEILGVTPGQTKKGLDRSMSENLQWVLGQDDVCCQDFDTTDLSVAVGAGALHKDWVGEYPRQTPTETAGDRWSSGVMPPYYQDQHIYVQEDGAAGIAAMTDMVFRPQVFPSASACGDIFIQQDLTADDHCKTKEPSTPDEPVVPSYSPGSTGASAATPDTVIDPCCVKFFSHKDALRADRSWYQYYRLPCEVSVKVSTNVRAQTRVVGTDQHYKTPGGSNSWYGSSPQYELPTVCDEPGLCEDSDAVDTWLYIRTGAPKVVWEQTGGSRPFQFIGNTDQSVFAGAGSVNSPASPSTEPSVTVLLESGTAKICTKTSTLSDIPRYASTYSGTKIFTFRGMVNSGPGDEAALNTRSTALSEYSSRASSSCTGSSSRFEYERNPETAQYDKLWLRACAGQNFCSETWDDSAVQTHATLEPGLLANERVVTLSNVIEGAADSASIADGSGHLGIAEIMFSMHSMPRTGLGSTRSCRNRPTASCFQSFPMTSANSVTADDNRFVDLTGDFSAQTDQYLAVAPRSEVDPMFARWVTYYSGFVSYKGCEVERNFESAVPLNGRTGDFYSSLKSRSSCNVPKFWYAFWIDKNQNLNEGRRSSPTRWSLRKYFDASIDTVQGGTNPLITSTANDAARIDSGAPGVPQNGFAMVPFLEEESDSLSYFFGVNDDMVSLREWTTDDGCEASVRASDPMQHCAEATVPRNQEGMPMEPSLTVGTVQLIDFTFKAPDDGSSVSAGKGRWSGCYDCGRNRPAKSGVTDNTCFSGFTASAHGDGTTYPDVIVYGNQITGGFFNPITPPLDMLEAVTTAAAAATAYSATVGTYLLSGRFWNGPTTSTGLGAWPSTEQGANNGRAAPAGSTPRGSLGKQYYESFGRSLLGSYTKGLSALVIDYVFAGVSTVGRVGQEEMTNGGFTGVALPAGLKIKTACSVCVGNTGLSASSGPCDSTCSSTVATWSGVSGTYVTVNGGRYSSELYKYVSAQLETPRVDTGANAGATIDGGTTTMPLRQGTGGRCGGGKPLYGASGWDVATTPISDGSATVSWGSMCQADSSWCRWNDASCSRTPLPADKLASPTWVQPSVNFAMNQPNSPTSGDFDPGFDGNQGAQYRESVQKDYSAAYVHVRFLDPDRNSVGRRHERCHQIAHSPTALVACQADAKYYGDDEITCMFFDTEGKIWWHEPCPATGCPAYVTANTADGVMQGVTDTWQTTNPKFESATAGKCIMYTSWEAPAMMYEKGLADEALGRDPSIPSPSMFDVGYSSTDLLHAKMPIFVKPNAETGRVVDGQLVDGQLVDWSSMPLLNIDGFALEYHGFTATHAAAGASDSWNLYGSKLSSFGVDAWVMELSDSCKLAGTCEHFCHIDGVRDYVENVQRGTCASFYDCETNGAETDQDCCCNNGGTPLTPLAYTPGAPYCTPCSTCPWSSDYFDTGVGR